MGIEFLPKFINQHILVVDFQEFIKDVKWLIKREGDPCIYYGINEKDVSVYISINSQFQDCDELRKTEEIIDAFNDIFSFKYSLNPKDLWDIDYEYMRYECSAYSMLKRTADIVLNKDTVLYVSNKIQSISQKEYSKRDIIELIEYILDYIGVKDKCVQIRKISNVVEISFRCINQAEVYRVISSIEKCAIPINNKFTRLYNSIVNGLESRVYRDVQGFIIVRSYVVIKE